MNIWQADFYCLPSLPGQDREGELTIADSISRKGKDMAFEVSRINRTSPQKFKLSAQRRKGIEILSFSNSY